MRRAIFSLLLVLLLIPASARAGRRIEIHLRIPQPLAVGLKKQTIVLGRITDRRHFEDRPSLASTPSVAVGSVARTTPSQLRYYIGRVRNDFGKARNNVFLSHDQPVEEVVRELLTKSLAAQGYKVVSAPPPGDAKVQVMDVDIDQLWGFIETGIEWGGAMPAMAGRIETELTVRGPQGTRSYKVSGAALHHYMRMTPEHWVEMFEELFLNYQGNLARLRF